MEVANRFDRAVAGVYEARERDWRSLCDTVCRIIVEHGKVVSAVIRMPDRDGAVLVPFAGAGPLGGTPGGPQWRRC